MKYNFFFLFLSIIFFPSCKDAIKNEKQKVIIESGVQISEGKKGEEIEQKSIINQDHKLIGFWVGYFEQDTEETKELYVDEGFYWSRENKINISIDRIKGDKVFGHSVVAGNDRSFKGLITKTTSTPTEYLFTLNEPGDNKYDGKFTFIISKDKLIGKWTAYNDLDIKHRKYTLSKKTFKYNPNIKLEHSKSYVDWTKYNETVEQIEMEENEFEEWVSKEFSSATNKIYEINASSILLRDEDVNNLKKGDLKIIRNTIYARHGYSFKNRPLRVFFDAQNWYIPVHSNIKNEFTDIEKHNIKLLLKYEKNATEYYDTFGRG